MIQHYFIQVEDEDLSKKLYVVEVEKSPELVVIGSQDIFIRVGDTDQRESPKVTLSKVKSPGIAKTLKKVDQSREEATESKLNFLSEYRSLFYLLDQSAEILTLQLKHLPENTMLRGRVLTRLIFASLVNTFEIYLADLLLEIYLAQPNTLKSQSTVTVEEVLNCQDMAEFIHFAAYKRVQKLKRGDTRGFAEEFRKSTGITICQCAPYNVPGSCTQYVPPSCSHNVPGSGSQNEPLW